METTQGKVPTASWLGSKRNSINSIVERESIQTVVEFGCGDGAQLSLAKYPNYRGYDVASGAVKLCREKHQDDSTKSFALLDEYDGDKFDLAMSLDVIYHLVEDEVFESHLKMVFGAGEKLVIVYSSDLDLHSAPHVKHRKFTSWVNENITGWKLSETIKNPFPYNEETRSGSRADFFVYEPA